MDDIYIYIHTYIVNSNSGKSSINGISMDINGIIGY